MDQSPNTGIKPCFTLWPKNYPNGFHKYTSLPGIIRKVAMEKAHLTALALLARRLQIAVGGDIENLEKFVEAIEQRCPAITLSIVQDDEIKQMSAEIEQEVTKLKPFVGTLKVHQITGKFYNPLGLKSNSIALVMKHLSCFCNNDHCVHFNIGKIIYEDKPKHLVETVFSDSEPENEAGPSSVAVNRLQTGDHILVKLLSKNMEYRYVSVIDNVDEEDGETRVTFLKLYDNKGQTFRFDQDDVADITMDQVIEKLPNPNILLKGNIIYKF